MQETENQKHHPRKTVSVLASILIFAVFFVMLNQNPWSELSIRNVDGTIGYTENPWVLKQEGNVIDSSLELPAYMRMERGKLYTMSAVMTYDGTKDNAPTAFIHLDHAYCRVLLDGEVIFSCMPEDMPKWDKSKASGFIYKAFSLPDDCKGKIMDIEILPLLTVDIEYGLPEIMFGDMASTVHRAVLRDAPHDVIVVLCVILGMLTIAFSTVILKDSEYREGMSIGIFSLLFSLYLLTECKLNYYYIGNPYYVYIVNYIVFSLLPVSLMGFMRERIMEKHRKVFTAAIRVELIMFAAEMILHFGGIFDMREIVHIIHLVYFTDMVLVTIFIMNMDDTKRKHSLVIQLTPMIIGMLMDVMIYWLHLDIGQNDATFTILGVIIFLIIELFHVWRSSISIYTESVRSSLYRQMAYTDELTGIGNRRCYEREIENIISKEKTYGSMIVASADVNRLKYVNDHYGHAVGDSLIKNVARIMTEAVGESGRIFRTGGDEFAIFLYDTDVKKYDEMMEEVKNKIDDFNSRNDFSMSLAVGYVQIENNNILEAVRAADYKMYADKAQYKASIDRETK